MAHESPSGKKILRRVVAFALGLLAARWLIGASWGGALLVAAIAPVVGFVFDAMDDRAARKARA